jgi:3-deoxy-manno-octulosonate cytidylyltransferase (CMP-KDO synthetase)
MSFIKSKDPAILIPARYNSSRLPGKPLVKLNNVEMIKIVAFNCKMSGLDTYVLTDDDRIASLFDPSMVIFDDNKEITNGTGRCSMALNDDRMLKYDYFINVQGDMPDVNVNMINKIHAGLYYDGCELVTLHTALPDHAIHDSNTVKIILNRFNEVQWCGRGFTYGHHHLGIYGYEWESLTNYNEMDPSPEESIEGLEQLRWLHHGRIMHSYKVDFDGIEINTPEDVCKWHDSSTQDKY